MPRKLVTVRQVAAVRPIPGADRIETAVVDGWTCVVKVGEVTMGDLAVFFEIDSFLPAEDPRWAFLEKQFTTFDGSGGFRVRSTKLRGQMSQGILQPLAAFPEIQAIIQELEKEFGKDETAKQIKKLAFEEQLKVKKWELALKKWESTSEAPIKPEKQTTMGPFPGFIRKTEQERIQNLPEVFDEWGDEVFQETTKMDGSSMTVYFLRKDNPLHATVPPFNPTGGRTGDMETGHFGVCSHNCELVERATGSMFWEIALQRSLPEKLAKLDRNLAVQGELCGSSIQANYEGFSTGFHEFYVFSAWDIDKQTYLAPRETEQWARDLGLKHVPVHGYSKLKDIGNNVEEMLKRAEGKGINGKKREGIVLKHKDGEFSFKAISNSWLLRHGS